MMMHFKKNNKSYSFMFFLFKKNAVNCLLKKSLISFFTSISPWFICTKN